MKATRAVLVVVGILICLFLTASTDRDWPFVSRKLMSVEECAASAQVWGVDSPCDVDYVLNVAAFDYLPPDSAVPRALGQALGYVYWCGTPMVYFEEKYGPEVSVPERYLVLRARRLQEHYAPEELRGPFVVEAVCATPNCSGRVSILRKLSALE